MASAYQTALERAVNHDCQSIALPALSTGGYRYPPAEAAAVAVRTVVDFLSRQSEVTPLALERFVLFSNDMFRTFKALL